MISKKNKVTNQLTDHLGNVRAVVSKDNNGNAAALVSATDYYPGGMPMPGRQFVNGKPYRYSFQGQEKDAETGKVAFQLRLYDPRINRWLTTDPAGQYHSPYMGMGNNPISRIDPDGGEDYNPVYDKNGSFLGTTESGFTGEALIMDAADFTQGMADVDAFSLGTFLSDFNASSQLQDLIHTHIANYKLGDGLDVGNGAIHIHSSNKVGNYTPYTAASGSKDDLLILRNKNSNGFFEPTVENIRSAVNNHEVKGHLLLGLGAKPAEHIKIYEMQIKHKNFHKTTDRFKKITVGTYLYQGGTKFKNYHNYGNEFLQKREDYKSDKIKNFWDMFN